MWTLCLLMLHPVSTFIPQSPASPVSQSSQNKELLPLFDLKDRFEEASAGGGKIQINPMPARLKRILVAGSSDQVADLLKKMKS